MIVRFALALGFGLFWSGFALACSTAPAPFITHHTQLVREAGNIVLAKAIGPSDDVIRYGLQDYHLAEFETIEILKGTAAPTFTIKNGLFLPEADVGPQDFDGHRNLDFWERIRTRQSNTPGCQMRPVFLKDRTYLLFLDTPHWRSYEEIVDPNDLWLAGVRALVQDPDLPSGLTLTPNEWFAEAEGVFLGSLEDCHVGQLHVKTVLKGTFAGHWPEKRGVIPKRRILSGCVVGLEYLVVTFPPRKESSRRRSPIVLKVSGGTIDLSKRRRGEVRFERPVMLLDEVSQLFEK